MRTARSICNETYKIVSSVCCHVKTLDGMVLADDSIETYLCSIRRILADLELAQERVKDLKKMHSSPSTLRLVK